MTKFDRSPEINPTDLVKSPLKTALVIGQLCCGQCKCGFKPTFCLADFECHINEECLLQGMLQKLLLSTYHYILIKCVQYSI